LDSDKCEAHYRERAGHGDSEDGRLIKDYHGSEVLQGMPVPSLASEAVRFIQGIYD
jgi:hypothetical protein